MPPRSLQTSLLMMQVISRAAKHLEIHVVPAGEQVQTRKHATNDHSSDRLEQRHSLPLLRLCTNAQDCV